MKSGSQPPLVFPQTYRDFYLLRTHGRVYGIPPWLDPAELRRLGTLWTHPSVLNAGTLVELESLIDAHDGPEPVAEQRGSFQGYELIYHRGTWYGVPQQAGEVDLDLIEERQAAGVLAGQTPGEVQGRIRKLQAAVPIEFTGWLPIVALMGNCGRHPQFGHTATPPAGYRFTHTVPPTRPPSALRRGIAWLSHRVSRAGSGLTLLFRPFYAALQRGPHVSYRARLRLLVALVRLFIKLKRSGARLADILRYLRSRSYASQVLLAENRGLLFLASAPYTYNQNPWVIEIEDPTTLFFPFLQNGMTCDLDIAGCPYYPIVKAQLEDERCKGIITHIRSTARMLPRLFASEIIARKVFYAPLGVKVPARWQRQDEREPEHLNLLFINSWCQHPGNLQVRGGLDILEAFAILHERYPHVRLTLRSGLPELDDHYYRILESGWVRVINRFLSHEEMEALHAESHIFLLPAARIHVVSLLQAMAAGLAVVTSDGWGIEEYVTHERNGLVVKGRYGSTSWADEEAGLLREDYQPVFTADPDMVQRIVEAVTRLIEDPDLRRRLGQNARHDVESTFNLETWNHGLKGALDQALGVVPAAEVADACPRPEPCPV